MSSGRLLLCLILLSSLANAGTGREVQVGLMHGFSAPHRPVMKGIITERTSFVEAIYVERGKRLWQQHHRFPAAGICFLYGNLGNPAVLGNAAALYPYLQFYPINTAKTHLVFGLGMGLSWTSKFWRLSDNYSNLALSLPLTSSIVFRLGINRVISKSLSAGLACGLTHFSNGSSRQPNLGLNNLALRLSMAWKLSEFKPESKESIPADSTNRGGGWFVFAGAFPKQVSPVLGNVYLPVSLSAGYSGRWGRRWGWAAGADFFYDASLRAEVSSGINNLQNWHTVFQSGLMIGAEYRYNRLVLPIQTGVYVYDRIKFHGPVYSRFGMRVRMVGPLWYSIMLKSHFEKADFVEMGLGIRWH